jgi:hypothetical protein
MSAPLPGPFRPGVVPGPFRPAPPPAAPSADRAEGSGHPAVDAVIQAIANAADLSPADQIAQYEAAHRTLQETLATIDQA